MEVRKIRLLKAFVLLFCCFSMALAVAEEKSLAKGQYIVVLKDNLFSQGLSVTASGESMAEIVKRLMDGVRENQLMVDAQQGVFRTQAEAEEVNKDDLIYEHALRGFSAVLTDEAVEYMKKRPEIKYIEQDNEIHLHAVQSPTPSWGLDRIDQRNLPLNQSYQYHSDGTNVHMYIIDTGLAMTHPEFTGRIGVGYDFYDDDGDASDNCRGHGTHVAGTAAGTSVGIAKRVTIHPLRVFGCNQQTTFSSIIIDALDAVVQHHESPSVVNMSLGGGIDRALDEAVQRVIDEGVTVVVSAGNYGINACNASPARVTDAITVAASDASDARSIWSSTQSSNVGPCVDVVAPGTGIDSAFIPGLDIPNRTSCDDPDGDGFARCNGTSMASPHVAGLAALYLQRHPSARPSEVASAINGASTKNTITDVKVGTPNRLAFNQFSSSLAMPNIVGIAYVDSHKMACAWYDNNTVSCGATYDLNSVRRTYRYTLPVGYTPNDIVDIAWVGSHHMACAWYKNGKVSCGSTRDLDSARKPYNYSLPRGYSTSDIKGIAWVPAEKMACAWYADGKGSCGTTGDLDRKLGLTGYTLPPEYHPRNIVAVAWVEHRNWQCTWYNNGYASCGNGTDMDSVRAPYRYKTLE
ncbi:MAG: S8 family peptidase [Candidatus Thiodiazotropha sp.]